MNQKDGTSKLESTNSFAKADLGKWITMKWKIKKFMEVYYVRQVERLPYRNWSDCNDVYTLARILLTEPSNLILRNIC